MLAVDDNLKEKLLAGINMRCKLLIKLKTEIKKNCIKIIESVNRKCNELTRELNNEKILYDSIKKMLIQNNEIDNVEYGKGFILDEQSINLEVNITVIQNGINQFFQKNFKIQADDSACFWISGNILSKVDLNTFKKTTQTLSATLGRNNNSSCKLSNKFFIHGNSSNNCYLLDLNTNNFSWIISFSKYSDMSAVGYINDSVYIINGYHNPGNEKYNINTCQWSNIAPCPLNQHYNSGGVILDKMCITCSSESTPYIFDPETNVYTAQMNIPVNGFKPVGHGYILSSQSIYKVQENNANQWSEIQYQNFVPNLLGSNLFCASGSQQQFYGDYHENSYVFKKGKYLYVIGTNFKIWQFDTILYKVIELKITQF